MGWGLRGRDDGGNVNNVQYKSDWNYHFESPSYNEYLLIKMLCKKRMRTVSVLDLFH
jgi:hypothetical protein